MTLRRKTFVIITTILLLLVLFLYFLSRIILLNSYLQLEENIARNNTSRVLNALARELEQLSRTTADWAYWDDTYYFVQDRNEAYIAANLTDGTLASLHLNFLILVDNDGEVVLSKFVDLETEMETGPMFNPEEIVPLLVPDFTDLKGDVRSILQTSGGPVLATSRYLLTSLAEGPVQGRLILGYMLDDSKVEDLSQTLNTSLRLHPPTFPVPVDGLQPVVTAVQTNPAAIAVYPIDRNTVAGYALISNLINQPVLLLEVDTPREVYQQGLATFTYYILSLVIVGALFIVVTLLLLDRIVLSRLNQLSQRVDDIRRTGDLTLPIQVDGEDELSTLARETREMLSEIAAFKEALENSNLELEARVRQRTEELLAANEALRVEVSQRERAQEQLAAARDQALEALNLKTQILANISHDARTPLNIVSLRAEMMLRESYGQVTPKQKDALETILLSAHELLHFINNLLQESQTRANAARLHNALFSLNEVVQEVVALTRPIAERKNLKLNVEISPDSSLTYLHGDVSCLKRILSNLVDNAIKFTEYGEVTVRGFLPDSDHWAISVTDTGPGIAEADMASIFEAFWQADGSITRTAGRGVGLGLSIVKQMTLLMEGKVTVQSNSSGSTFTVSFPFRTAGSGGGV